VTTARQLAEAQAYARRRLVTAFVTGRSPERVGEPPRSGRPLLAGVAVAVLVLAGTVVRSVLTNGGG